MSIGVLVDTTKCIGCRSCQVACKAWNDKPSEDTTCLGSYENPPQLSAKTLTKVKYTELEVGDNLKWVMHKVQCMHCKDPACVSVCPVEALHKTDLGPVIYEEGNCIGCRYCMMACPFNVPKIDWDSLFPQISKCTLCFDRISNGEQPACVKSCPTGAIKFGDRIELLGEAKSRIKNYAGRYVEHVYGEKEVGGTSWLYLSPVPFEKLGFPTLGPEPITKTAEDFARIGIPTASVVLAALSGGLYWLFRRREILAKTKVSIERDEE
ncbi:MAG: 4Fe-4S dicluster domain-containing protein [Anaerolineaceae bacterium]|nr:4Fe-4S dicluster domain-containing protein [Anaerolineaceae bacterium]